MGGGRAADECAKGCGRVSRNPKGVRVRVGTRGDRRHVGAPVDGLLPVPTETEGWGPRFCGYVRRELARAGGEQPSNGPTVQIPWGPLLLSPSPLFLLLSLHDSILFSCRFLPSLLASSAAVIPLYLAVCLKCAVMNASPGIL